MTIRQTAAKISRNCPLGSGFIDSCELVPNYTDSVYFWSSRGSKCFSRSPVRASGRFLLLSGGVWKEKLLPDRRRMADTVVQKWQWIWSGCSLDSAGQPAGSADLEVELWLPPRGFKGNEDIEFFNQFRRKNFRGWKIFEGIDGYWATLALGVRLADFERKVRETKIFPLEIKITLKRRLPAGQPEYHFHRQVVELYPERRDAGEFMVSGGFKRVLEPDAGGVRKGKK